MVDSLNEDIAAVRAAIADGRTSLGIELGSTRIKAALIGPGNVPVATGSHEWNNQLVDRMWTYDLDLVWAGLQDCFAQLASDVSTRYGVPLTRVGALGFSAMMHGYLAFDAGGQQLVPFRTWRNTNTGPASSELTGLFSYNIPHRWSIAHLYQAVLNGEEHLPQLAYLTTLAGYVHWQLTGLKVLGVGDASGMFPIDISSGQFDAAMVATFDRHIADRGYPWKLADVVPTVLSAGDDAGALTESGARLLDPSGTLEAGVPMCPPEGDAGTGMVATNSVAPRTGNVSAGTSIFAMIVLEHDLSTVYPEIDMVTTPSGDLVGMVHCNNGTGDLDAWVRLFGEFADALGVEVDTGRLFEVLYGAALHGDADAGGLLAYNYLSGEPITSLEEGRPLFVRTPESRFTLANFMRTHLFSSLASLRVGMDILFASENVRLASMFAHGGLFKTKGVAQQILAAAIKTPVSVGEIAGEGGAWGMALLAAYRRDRADGESLSDYLATKVFQAATVDTIAPLPADVEGFDAFMTRYRRGLPVEQAAVEGM